MIHDTRQRHFFNLRGPSSHIHAKSHRVSLHAYRTHLNHRDQHAALRSDGHDHCGHARPARAPIRLRVGVRVYGRDDLPGSRARLDHRVSRTGFGSARWPLDEAIGLPNGRESQRGVLRGLCPHGCSVIRTPCFQSRAAWAPARVEGVG